MTALASLLLADSRLPTGGHVHSGGVEAAVERGLVRDEADLALFLADRLRGSGLVVAAVAAAACLLADTALANWCSWDAAVSARIPSAAAREASRAQGFDAASHYPPGLAVRHSQRTGPDRTSAPPAGARHGGGRRRGWC